MWCAARPQSPHRGNSLTRGSHAVMGSCLSLYSGEEELPRCGTGPTPMPHTGVTHWNEVNPPPRVFHHHSTVMVESCPRVGLDQPPCHVLHGVTQWNESDIPPRFTLHLFTVKTRSYPGCGVGHDPTPLTGVTP